MKNLLVISSLLILSLSACTVKNMTKDTVPSPATESTEPTAINTAAAPSVEKKMTEQEMALKASEVKDSFAAEFALEKAAVAEPLIYDINNDGQDENVLSAVIDQEAYMIGVYNAEDGKKLAGNKYESTASVQISKLKNKSFGNCLAVLHVGMGGYSADVITIKDGALATIATVESEVSSEDDILDIDKDGFEEFKGVSYDYGPGSDRLSRRDAFKDEVIFKWNEKELKYIEAMFGEDGLLDQQRNNIANLTKEKALKLVKAAQDLQLAWDKPVKNEQDVQKRLRPFFSNNFIHEFVQDGTVDDGGIMPKYSLTEDGGWLVPNFSKAATLIVSDEGYVDLKETMKQDSEVAPSKYNINVNFVKTKYGWKIDGISHETLGG